MRLYRTLLILMDSVVDIGSPRMCGKGRAYRSPLRLRAFALYRRKRERRKDWKPQKMSEPGTLKASKTN